MDLEAVLGELETLDRKAVAQLRKKDYQTALAALPEEERVLAVLPVALHDIAWTPGGDRSQSCVRVECHWDPPR